MIRVTKTGVEITGRCGSTRAVRSRRRLWSSAFTLVELLVVIGIISILAALLLPVLSKSLSSARDVTCRNNLRQIGSMHSAYVADFGYFPVADLSNPNFRRYTWDNDLVTWGYSAYESIYSLNYNPHKLGAAQRGMARLYCTETSSVANLNPDIPVAERGGRTYAGAKDGNIRGALGLYNYSVEAKNFVKAASALHHSRKLVIADSSAYHFFDGNDTMGAAWGKLALAHFDRCNGIYLDGHVEGHDSTWRYSRTRNEWYYGFWDVTKPPAP